LELELQRIELMPDIWRNTLPFSAGTNRDRCADVDQIADRPDHRRDVRSGRNQPQRILRLEKRGAQGTPRAAPRLE